jgi:putative transposase
VARAVRIEYGGAFYHVMARGNRRERIFRDEADRVLFYQTLGEACERTGWRVHAWVLMSNHYHLMVETPEANLVAGMRWLQNTYTRRHKLPASAVGAAFRRSLQGNFERGEIFDISL